MAIQFASNLQHAWATHLEDCGTFMLEILKLKAKTERIEEGPLLLVGLNKTRITAALDVINQMALLRLVWVTGLDAAGSC